MWNHCVQLHRPPSLRKVTTEYAQVGEVYGVYGGVQGNKCGEDPVNGPRPT